MGKIEALNDAGLGDVREAIDVFHKTREVLGAKPQRNRAPVINRGYGHMKNMQYSPSETSDVPYVMKGYLESERYIRGILNAR